MIAAGFAMDMVTLFRTNRAILKSQSLYKPFDRSYITDAIISREAPSYRVADPKYLSSLRQSLIAARDRAKHKNHLAMLLSVMITGVLAVVYFSF
ncbi:MAG: hypothetical protein KI790_02920 [Cyclobacteriaceae bacterium]|nr:hypothetical protein [Cyclobacteriaceae bacterium HetDA_MAG_MS6]